MERYEKSIGLKTIWLTIVRRFLTILVVFAPIAIATVVYTQFFIKKTYTSSVTLTADKDITAAAYSSFPIVVKSEDIAKEAERNLAKLDEEGNPILDENDQPLKATTHADGSRITWGEIQGGLSVASSISLATRKLSFSFQGYEQGIIKPILDEVAKAIVAADPYKASAIKLTASEATSATKNSSENKYLLIGMVAAVVLGLGFGFVDEIVSDEVYDKKDIELLGCDGFEITVNK
jgi:capsular polysaccharide biosynthesis protein